MNRLGFTLLEISIVLVIIGLIIGGITVGQDLIRSSELNSIITEANKWRVAIREFKLKYSALPGDMDNAIDYWGAAHATPATCIDTVGTGTETCDGDGDGLMGDAQDLAEAHERFRAWQQLVNAELVSGNYTGVSGGGGAFPSEQPIIGTNVPESAFPAGGWTIYPIGNLSGHASHFDGKYGNSFFFGAEFSNATSGVLLVPDEAFSIDTKYDDGKAARGNIRVNKNASQPCATTDSSATAEYALTLNTPSCSLILINGF